jgi:ATPase family protein associated with various cellular activities (AAA)/AAA domain-containing protein
MRARSPLRSSVIGGYGGTGKTALICNVIADNTRRGKHVVIWHSGEDSQAKWERRIELNGGVMALVHFVETQAEVWAVLEASDPPAMLVIDPLQQFLDSGAKNDEAVQKNMNELTRLAAKNSMAVVAIMHWKEHYRDKLVGSEVVWQIARMIHRVERGDAENNWILRRVRSQDAPLNWFRRFYTYKLDPNDPVLAKFASTQWEPAAKETEEQEIDRFILETTEGRPHPVRNLRKDVGEHGQWNYPRRIVPHLKRRMGWKQIRVGGYQGPQYWYPPDYRWLKERGWQRKEDGAWIDVGRTVKPLPPEAMSKTSDIWDPLSKSDEDGEEGAKGAKKNRLADLPKEIAELLRKKGNYDHSLPYLTKLPWNLPEEKPIDLVEAQRILNEDHYGLDTIKERIIEHVAVLKLVPHGKAPILCLVGPPGVGKTSLGQSFARAMGRKFVRVSLGGVSTESFIRGHEFTFLNSQPGIVIRALCEVRARNCVMLLDEIDKLGNSVRHGDPAAALLEVLDPAQNNAFRDVYLDVPFDLSRIVFIATANDLDKIPAPLRDRMEVIEHNGYTRERRSLRSRLSADSSARTA